MLIKDILSADNFDGTVYEARDGREALDFLYHRGPYGDSPRPRLIYLDIEMPKLSGQEVLRIVKSDPDLHSIPVVMLTTGRDEHQKGQAVLNGADGFSVKSADPLAFVESITRTAERWLNPRRNPRSGPAQTIA